MSESGGYGIEGVMAAAGEVQGFCVSQGWRFCFIGGLAVQRWGMPRFTQDVDLTLLTGFGDEQRFIDMVLQHFSGRRADVREFALRYRVLLASSSGGVHLDFALGAYPYEEATVDRATLWKFSELISLITCSAEDLIIHKVFASRPRDWSDVESVLARQYGHLNLASIRKELPPLLELKDDGESFDKFERLIETVEKRQKK